MMTYMKIFVATILFSIAVLSCTKKDAPTSTGATYNAKQSSSVDDRATPKSIQVWETIAKLKPGERKLPPEVNELLGKEMELGGFMILNEANGENVREFLLTPISGGCVHVPPPPPNYIVHVLMPEGATTKFTYGPILVTGTLSIPSRKEDQKYYGLEMKGKDVGPFIYK